MSTDQAIAAQIRKKTKELTDCAQEIEQIFVTNIDGNIDPERIIPLLTSMRTSAYQLTLFLNKESPLYNVILNLYAISRGLLDYYQTDKFTFYFELERRLRPVIKMYLNQ